MPGVMGLGATGVLREPQDERGDGLGPGGEIPACAGMTGFGRGLGVWGRQGRFESLRVNGEMGDGIRTGARFLPAQE